MMSGVNIVNGYPNQIFDKIGQEGTYSTSQKNYFVGCSGFLGALTSQFAVAYLKRRTIMIGGQTLMAILLLMIALFIVNKKPDATIYSMSAFIFTF